MWNINISDILQKHMGIPRVVLATTRRPSLIFSLISHLKLNPHWCAHEKTKMHISPLSSLEEKTQWGRKTHQIGRRGRKRREGGRKKKNHTVCPLSRCHPAGRSLIFRPCDKARPRVDGSPAILTLIWRAAVAMGMKHWRKQLPWIQCHRTTTRTVY